MKHMVLERLQAAQFSKEVCADLKNRLADMHVARWFHRDKINSRPTAGTTEASYDFLGDRQQPKDFNKLLRNLAPVYPGYFLGEAIINRYKPGDWMPEHLDVQMYRKNVVIALCEDGDGIEIEGLFHPDVQGTGVCFDDLGIRHAVPKVKSLRYVAIFLYE